MTPRLQAAQPSLRFTPPLDRDSLLKLRPLWLQLSKIPCEASRPHRMREEELALFEPIDLFQSRMHMRLVTDDTLSPEEVSEIRYLSDCAARVLKARIAHLFTRQFVPATMHELRRDIRLFIGVAPEHANYFYELQTRKTEK